MQATRIYTALFFPPLIPADKKQTMFRQATRTVLCIHSLAKRQTERLISMVKVNQDEIQSFVVGPAEGLYTPWVPLKPSVKGLKGL